MSTYEIVRQAIIDQPQIIGVYDGHYRELCPHMIGTKNGREQALFFQFGGETSDGPILDPLSRQNWKCMQLSKFTEIQARPGPWHTADNHTKPSTCVDAIDIQVQI